MDIFTAIEPGPSDYKRKHWPEVIAKQGEEIAHRLGVDPAMAAWSAFSNLLLFCHDDHRIQPKANDKSWTERPCLWSMIVQGPGGKKTPVDAYNRKVVRKLEGKHAEDYSKAKTTYDDELKLYGVKIKLWRKGQANYTHSGTSGDDDA